MSISLEGTPLTQPQLNAIIPVLNRNMQLRTPMQRKKFDEACKQAMAKAGCPFTPAAPPAESV